MADTGSLTQGERVVLRLHPHAKTMVLPVLVLVLIVVVAVAILVLLPASAPGALTAAVGAAALLGAAAWFVVPLLRWRTTVYEVTNRRLRMRAGILSRSGRDFPLNRITDMSFSQGLLDRAFGCGRLVVESPGENGRLVLSEIPDVRRVHGVLFDLVGEEEARYGRAGLPGDGT